MSESEFEVFTFEYNKIERRIYNIPVIENPKEIRKHAYIIGEIAEKMMDEELFEFNYNDFTG